MKKEVIEKMAALVTAALGFVAALAWNDAIKEIFKKFFGNADTIGAMLVYSAAKSQKSGYFKFDFKREEKSTEYC